MNSRANFPTNRPDQQNNIAPPFVPGAPPGHDAVAVPPGMSVPPFSFFQQFPPPPPAIVSHNLASCRSRDIHLVINNHIKNRPNWIISLEDLYDVVMDDLSGLGMKINSVFDADWRGCIERAAQTNKINAYVEDSILYGITDEFRHESESFVPSLRNEVWSQLEQDSGMYFSHIDPFMDKDEDVINEEQHLSTAYADKSQSTGSISSSSHSSYDGPERPPTVIENPNYAAPPPRTPTPEPAPIPSQEEYVVEARLDSSLSAQPASPANNVAACVSSNVSVSSEVNLANCVVDGSEEVPVPDSSLLSASKSSSKESSVLLTSSEDNLTSDSSDCLTSDSSESLSSCSSAKSNPIESNELVPQPRLDSPSSPPTASGCSLSMIDSAVPGSATTCDMEVQESGEGVAAGCSKTKEPSKEEYATLPGPDFVWRVKRRIKPADRAIVKTAKTEERSENEAESDGVPEYEPPPTPLEELTREQREARIDLYNNARVEKKLFNVPAKFAERKPYLDAKDECLKLFGKTVKNFSLLAYSLRLLYELRGPVLHKDIMAGAIDLALSGGHLDTCINWGQHGVKETRLAGHQLVVKAPIEKIGGWLQPHPAILKANFTCLPSGLPTQLYKCLRSKKEPQETDYLVKFMDESGSYLRGWEKLTRHRHKRNALWECATLFPVVFNLDVLTTKIGLNPDYAFFVVQHPIKSHSIKQP